MHRPVARAVRGINSAPRRAARANKQGEHAMTIAKDGTMTINVQQLIDALDDQLDTEIIVEVLEELGVQIPRHAHTFTITIDYRALTRRMLNADSVEIVVTDMIKDEWDNIDEVDNDVKITVTGDVERPGIPPRARRHSVGRGSVR